MNPTIILTADCDVNGRGQLSFTARTTDSGEGIPLQLSVQLRDQNGAYLPPFTGGDPLSREVYEVPNGTYTAEASDQDGETITSAAVVVNCTIVPNPGGGGIGTPTVPPGQLIASYCSRDIAGKRVRMYFDPATKAVAVTFTDDAACGLNDPAHPAADSVLYGQCDGTTRDRVYYRETDDAEYVAETNSTHCGFVAFTLFSSTPFAPVAPATTGRWQVDTSGGIAPRQVSIPGVTPAGGTLLDSTGYAELTGLAPGPYTATLTDSSSPVQTLVVNFTVPAATPAPAPTYPPALPGAPPQNLETFPFTDETPFDQLPTLCPDPAYYLATPQRSFLPFCLRLPRTPNRWLQCARVLDAVTGDVVEEFDPRLLAFEKFEDETSAYFLYYGSAVPGLVLPLCRPLRLQVDEMTSVAFVVQSDLSGYLWCRWWHDTPLQHLPYGTGLQQHLYVPGAVLREQDPREERTETKNAATAAVRVDFLAQARTVSFETEPLPAWLVQAVQGSRLHAWFAAGSSFYQGEYPVREAKQRELSAEFCGRMLNVTLEYAPVAVSGCGPQPPALVALPATYPTTC